MQDSFKLLFFGDSICFGEGVSPHLSFVNKISMGIFEEFGCDSPKIINHSINGDTSRMALDRISKDLQAEKAQIVYIQFGLNDCNYWQTDLGLPRVSPASFQANIEEIITRSRRFGAKQVLVATNHRTQPDGPLELKRSSQASTTYLENLTHYNALIREIAHRTNAVLIDIEKAWRFHVENIDNAEKYLISDGIHLSLKGNDFYASILTPTLCNIVRQILKEKEKVEL